MISLLLQYNLHALKLTLYNGISEFWRMHSCIITTPLKTQKHPIILRITASVHDLWGALCSPEPSPWKPLSSPTSCIFTSSETNDSEILGHIVFWVWLLLLCAMHLISFMLLLGSATHSPGVWDRWQRNTWNCAQHHYRLQQCQWRPQWDTTTYPSAGTVWKFLITWSVHLPFNPSVSLLSIHSNAMKIYVHLCSYLGVWTFIWIHLSSS